MKNIKDVKKCEACGIMYYAKEQNAKHICNNCLRGSFINNFKDLEEYKELIKSLFVGSHDLVKYKKYFNFEAYFENEILPKIEIVESGWRIYIYKKIK